MIHRKKPKEFSNELNVVGCFVEFDGMILILKRQDHDSFPNKWGLPAGGVLLKEDLLDGMKRELFEETGIKIDDDRIKYLDKIYVTAEEENKKNLVFYMYMLKLETKPEILLDPEEHKDYVWIKPEDVYDVDYMSGMDVCIDILIEQKKN